MTAIAFFVGLSLLTVALVCRYVYRAISRVPSLPEIDPAILVEQQDAIQRPFIH